MSGSRDTIDTAVLNAYLERHVDGFRGPLSLRKFSGGQSNPTFLLEAASGTYVLRSQPFGKLLKSAHAVDREFRVQRALATTEVPVATVFHLCEEVDVVGVKFYLMSCARGEIFWDPALPAIDRSERFSYYEEALRILAALHAVDPAAIGLGDFGRAGNYFERQIGVWTQQYRAAETHTVAPVEELIDWVQANAPDDDGSVALVHGDFRFDNIMFQPRRARGLALLDWELSTLGHPLADLAYFCMCLRIPSSEFSFGLGGRNRDQLAVPQEAWLVQRYCERRGIGAIARWEFYLAFSFFRLAAILQGVYKRSLDGNASSQHAGAMGGMVEQLATMALQLLRESH